jgi:hypothetical protein
MLIDGKSTSFIQRYIDISNDALDVMRKTTSKDVSDLISLIIARKAITLKVDTRLVQTVIHSFNHLLPTEIRYFMQRYNEKANIKSYLQPIYHQYIGFINEVVGKCLCMDSKKTEALGVTNGIIREMMELKAAYVPALEIALVKQGVIKLDVDELLLNTCLAAYTANVESKEVVLKLIKCGANHSFIKQYNGRIDVSLQFVKKWREIFSVNHQEETVSVKLGVEIWKDFNTFMVQQLSTIDVYLQLNRKHKLRIDTIYLFVTSAIKSELELNSEDDEEDAPVYVIN